MPYVDLLGYPIFFNDSGAGVPVVFLHNGFYSTETWNGVREAFASRFRVIDYDRYGYGKSAHIEADTLDDDFVERGVLELEALADALSLEAFHLVGHCLGGAVALLFAVRHPARVLKVAAEAVGFYGDLKSLVKTDMTFVPFERIEKALKRKMVAMHGAEYTQKLWRVLSSHKRSYIMNDSYDIRPEVFQLKAPLFLINGDRDFYFDIDQPAEIYRKLKKTARLWIVPTCGHDVHVEVPEDFTKNVLAFLDEA
jgi:pimeloyl-ACP methyl ester carboxylesterase